MMVAVTGKTEVTAFVAADVLEAAEAEAEVTTIVGTEGMISEIVIDEAMMTIPGVAGVAEAMVVIEVDMVTVTMHAHLILLAAVTANQQARQEVSLNHPCQPLVHRYVFITSNMHHYLT